MRQPDMPLREQVFSICAENRHRKLTARLFLESLDARGAPRLPSARTIQLWIQQWNEKQQVDQDLYAVVMWPETFIAGALLEAGGAYFELQEIATCITPDLRPTVDLVSWYWTLATLAPQLNGRGRRIVAACFALIERGLLEDRQARVSWAAAGASASEEAP